MALLAGKSVSRRFTSEPMNGCEFSLDLGGLWRCRRAHSLRIAVVGLVIFFVIILVFFVLFLFFFLLIVGLLAKEDIGGSDRMIRRV